MGRKWTRMDTPNRQEYVHLESLQGEHNRQGKELETQACEVQPLWDDYQAAQVCDLKLMAPLENPTYKCPTLRQSYLWRPKQIQIPLHTYETKWTLLFTRPTGPPVSTTFAPSLDLQHCQLMSVLSCRVRRCQMACVQGICAQWRWVQT